MPVSRCKINPFLTAITTGRTIKVGVNTRVSLVKDAETVYFLTEISENDLLNTTTDSNSETLPKNSAALESAIPTSDGALSNNNTNAGASNGTDSSISQDSTVGDNEEGTEVTETAESQAEQTEENPTAFYIILGVAALAVIGGGYYLKVVRKKKEDFLDEDDEDDEEEYEEDDSDEDSEEDFFTDDSGENENEEDEE